MRDHRVVNVEISGQRYPIRTVLDAEYVQRLAAYVDQRMRAAAEAAPSSDMLGLAVLTALNLADEFFRARHLRLDDADALTQRTAALEQMVDQALQLAGHRE